MARASYESMSREALLGEIRRLAELVGEKTDPQTQQGLFEELDTSTAQLVGMQQQLEEARDRYVALFDFAPIGYVVLDEHGVVTDVNLAAANLLGAQRQRLIGYPFHAFVTARRAFVELVREARGRGSPLELSVEIKPRTGDVRPARLTIKRLAGVFGDPVGLMAGFVMAIVDLTVQARMEREQRHSDEERRRSEHEEHVARAASEAKDRFLAVLSHELRTPLTPILFALRSLRDSTTLPDSLLPTIEMIARNVELEARLIEDLLDVTRITQGKMRLALEAVDTHAVVDEVVALCADEIREAGLTVSFDLAAAERHVCADGTRLRQVLWNLLKNAIRNTPVGGAIAVGSTNAADDRITLSVSDTGTGIAPEVLLQLFQPFVQGNEARERSGGLGLGLAISKGIVDAHGGRISATSLGRGRGARFTVELPTTPTPPVALPEPKRPARRAERARRVLLVEDNRDNAAAIGELLRSSGYEVDVAGSVAAAVEKAADGFDVLVSDIGLPDGTGRDLVQRLGGGTRAIALTGYGTDGDVRRNVDAGFARHLTKPVDPEELIAAIEEVCGEDAPRGGGGNPRRYWFPGAGDSSGLVTGRRRVRG